MARTRRRLLAPLPLSENFIIVLRVAARGPTTQVAPGRHDHTFHALRVARVRTETADAVTLVLEVPSELAATFRYEPGQFCTFRAVVDGVAHVRCYSMSSTPGVDDDLTVTVKRVPGGVVSGWMTSSLREGDVVEVAPPAGFFQLTPSNGELVLAAAGSGVTPVFSLLKAALATTARSVRLLDANQHPDAVIFRTALDALAAAHPDRLHIVHRYDVEEGFVDAAAVGALLDGASDPTCYVCGPGPFMDVVERALLDHGVSEDRIHIERFTPSVAAEPVVAAVPATITIELGGHTASIEHRPGTTILQTARELGLNPPSSCESGSCATCMARVLEGAVTMRVNNALEPDEVEAGWVLTCQSEPSTPTVKVVYE